MRKKISLITSIFLLSPIFCLGQGMPIDRFCEIYGDNAKERVDKIIRVFKLMYRPAEQLSGKADCKTGEKFVLKTRCMGANRIAILSLTHPGSNSYPSGASRLFHLKTRTSGDESLTPCQKTSNQPPPQ
ncbi:MAG: hypothetical protein MJE63_01570 [Proteobacteria bacterium]|nr:hypothetical protein [Pseudomonadota bacterium]